MNDKVYQNGFDDGVWYLRNLLLNIIEHSKDDYDAVETLTEVLENIKKPGMSPDE
jgi:hypothetical protein